MNLPTKVLNEKDPILREIYALGFDKVIDQPVSERIVLLDTTRKIKSVLDYHEFRRLQSTLKIITGASSIDERIHKWVSEADGSAERLRCFIEDNITDKSNYKRITI